MLINTLRRAGIKSDMAFAAALGSIATSIIAWRVRSDDDQGHAERLGIFIGLWAPTFWAIGNALAIEERAGTTEPANPVTAAKELVGTAQQTGQKAYDAVS